MELTESRVLHEFHTRVLGHLSSCSARWQHGILFTGSCFNSGIMVSVEYQVIYWYSQECSFVDIFRAVHISTYFVQGIYV